MKLDEQGYTTQTGHHVLPNLTYPSVLLDQFAQLQKYCQKRRTMHTSLILILALVLILIIIIIINAPISPSLALNPAHTLSPVSFANRLGVLLVNYTSHHERQHKHPDVASLHALPPATLHTNLPQTIDARSRAIQEETAAVATLNPGPESSKETAKEETLGGENMTGQPGLEETDRCPGS